MRRRSIVLVAALVAVTFSVWFYVRFHGSSARSLREPVVHAARDSRESSGAPITPSIGVSTARVQAMQARGFQQTKYNNLRKKFRDEITAYGPMDARDLGYIAESIKPQLRNPSLWPIVKDVLYGNTAALENALDSGLNPNVVVEKGNGNVESLLDMAIDTGQRGSIKALVAHGAAVNVDQYDLGKYGASTQDTTYVEPLVDAATAGEDDVVKYLLENGANINQGNNLIEDTRTALTAAAAGGNVSTVYLLLANGADVNTALDANGYVPQNLIQAAKRKPVYAAVVKLLVQYGARVPPGS